MITLKAVIEDEENMIKDPQNDVRGRRKMQITYTHDKGF